MSDCCAPGSATPPDAASERCPACGAAGGRVDPITLKALLTAEGLRRGVPPSPRFCATLGCPVVYFDNTVPVRFEETLLAVRVFAKHADDEDAPVCYCFDRTAGSIRREIAETGRSSAFQAIAAEVQAGHCACEVKNPKGACCLGDVSTLTKAPPPAAG